MKAHKYPVGSLLLSVAEKHLGYIQATDESFYGELLYDIYWFKDQYVSRNVSEKLVEPCIKLYKEKHELPNR